MAPLTAIPCFTWLPHAKPKAVLLCIHGLGLYGGTYSALGQRMAALGIATYALDVRGFGRWQKPGQADCALDFNSCLEDIRHLLQKMRAEHPGLPVFLLGESLGGAIASSAAADQEQLIDGLILSAPARVIHKHKREFVHIVYNAITQWGKPICISSAVFHHAPHVVAWGETDPLIRLNYTVAELMHLMQFLTDSFKQLRKLPDIPVLVVQGHSDQLITTQSTMQFFEQIPAADKELVVLGSTGHLIFQSQELTPKAVSLLRHWIREHLPASRRDLSDDPGELRRVS